MLLNKGPDNLASDKSERLLAIPQRTPRQFLDLARKLEEIAREKQCTPSQLAIARVMAQGNDIVPIPGTKRAKYLDENLAAANVRLSAEDLKRIDAAFPMGTTAGMRYAERAMAAVNR